MDIQNHSHEWFCCVKYSLLHSDDTPNQHNEAGGGLPDTTPINGGLSNSLSEVNIQ